MSQNELDIDIDSYVSNITCMYDKELTDEVWSYIVNMTITSFANTGKNGEYVRQYMIDNQIKIKKGIERRSKRYNSNFKCRLIS